MEANDLEKSSEEEIQPETSQMKEYPICLKNMHKSRNKKLKMNLKNYRRLLLEEQNRLLQEQRILQSRLQKYYNIESELKKLFSLMKFNLSERSQELNYKSDLQEECFRPTNFAIELQKKV